MSSPGVFSVPRDVFDNTVFAVETFTERSAYLWVSANERCDNNQRMLARVWRWPLKRVRAFLAKMLLSGLLREDGRHLVAVEIEAASPQPGYAPGETWGNIRLRVFARDGFKCVYCGSGNKLHCDHVLPKSRGGLDVESNLVAACAACNLSKGAKLLAEWRR